MQFAEPLLGYRRKQRPVAVDLSSLHPQTEPVLLTCLLTTRMMVILLQDPVRNVIIAYQVLDLPFYADMLGFKLGMPHLDGSLKEKARPIYLDMQVHPPSSKLS